MKLRRKDVKVDDIDISPLIDMVFILLIFFMVSSTFTKDMQLELDRPGANSAKKSSSKVIRVYIDKFSDIYLDGQPIKVWGIQGKLRDQLRASTEKSVLVVTDDGVTADKLVEVVDQCRLSGAKDIGVATQREAG